MNRRQKFVYRAVFALRVVLPLILAVVFFVSSINLHILAEADAFSIDQVAAANSLPQINLADLLSEPQALDIQKSAEFKIKSDADQKANVAKAKLRQAKINKVYTLMKNMRSPAATMSIAAIVVDKSEEYKADYRIIVGIMGNESGLCRIPTLKYNCFGYLNRVQYESYDEAFTRLVGLVSKQYASKYEFTLESIAALGKKYGATYPDRWAKNVYWFGKQVSVE